jgi:xanthine/uracil permease
VKLQLRRGAKVGAFGAFSFAVIAPINAIIRDQPIDSSKLLVGSVFAFIFFGLIGTLTDKLGPEVGD